MRSPKDRRGRDHTNLSIALLLVPPLLLLLREEEKDEEEEDSLSTQQVDEEEDEEERVARTGLPLPGMPLTMVSTWTSNMS